MRFLEHMQENPVSLEKLRQCFLVLALTFVHRGDIAVGLGRI
jgi:hypothetical protein